jgi:hypothetical protein
MTHDRDLYLWLQQQARSSAKPIYVPEGIEPPRTRGTRVATPVYQYGPSGWELRDWELGTVVDSTGRIIPDVDIPTFAGPEAEPVPPVRDITWAVIVGMIFTGIFVWFGPASHNMPTSFTLIGWLIIVLVGGGCTALAYRYPKKTHTVFTIVAWTLFVISVRNAIIRHDARITADEMNKHLR